MISIEHRAGKKYPRDEVKKLQPEHEISGEARICFLRGSNCRGYCFKCLTRLQSLTLLDPALFTNYNAPFSYNVCQKTDPEKDKSKQINDEECKQAA